MQYIPCNSAHLAQETLFLTQNKKALFLPKDLQKVRKSRRILICGKIAYVWLKIFVRVQTFRRGPPVHPHNFYHPACVASLGHQDEMSQFNCHCCC